MVELSGESTPESGGAHFTKRPRKGLRLLPAQVNAHTWEQALHSFSVILGYKSKLGAAVSKD